MSEPQSSTCSCGATRITIHKAPRLRFFCHCTICQRVYKSAFSDVVGSTGRAITIDDESTVTWGRFKSPPSVNRAICKSCDKPVVGYLTAMPGVHLTFAPNYVYPDQAALPQPSRHLYYETRVADVDDALPKHNGFWASNWGATKALF